MVDLITDTQNTGDVISCHMYDVPTEGSHPFMLCLPCNTDNEVTSGTLPSKWHTLISATSPATSPATYPATPRATSPATTQTTSPAISKATSPVTHPTTSPTTSDTPSSCANRVVDFLQLKETVDKNLGHCSTCKKGSLELIERQIDGFSSTFEIFCANCKKNKESLVNKMNYITKSVSQLTINNNADIRKRRLMMKQNNKNLMKLDKLQQKQERFLISQQKSRTDDSYSINTKAILASYYIGCGGYDIGSVANFLGVPGGLNWERRFTRKSPVAANVILDLVDKIVYDSLVVEVTLVIRKMMKDIMSAELIETNIEYFKSKQYAKMAPNLQHIGISISYDMGWQKRSTGRIYDSLSGHGFL